MGFTAITRVENNSSHTVQLLDIEEPTQRGHGIPIAAGQALDIDIHIPWATQAQDFPKHHLELQLDGQTRYWIWQAAKVDGDFVRFSIDGNWHDPGVRVHGVSAVDWSRTLLIWDAGFELVDFDLFKGFLDDIRPSPFNRFFSISGQPVDQNAASVPRTSSVGFSMAGIPSDAFDRGEQGTRFRYLDSGKRYQFEIRNGAAITHPDGRKEVRDGVVFAMYRDPQQPDRKREIPLIDAISYMRRRSGEQFTAPQFDLIASSGGRVFAKEKDRDHFYFTTMDHMFIEVGDDGREFPVPSTYFKLDPEYGLPGANNQDLTRHIDGFFADHPSVERFPLFRIVLSQNIWDFMIVAVQRYKWHLVDARPPVNALKFFVGYIELIRKCLSLLENPLPPLDPLRQQLETLRGDLQKVNQASLQADMAPPTGPSVQGEWAVPTYVHVNYSDGTSTPVSLLSISYNKVLGIGVGHVHWHEQYEGITGGELQPMRAAPIFTTPLGPIDYAFLYRIFNGPVRDGDGYIDGTCNFYALVRLKTEDEMAQDRLRYNKLSGVGVPDSYALLYTDEQSYFTQRWRMVHPDDYRGMNFSVVGDLPDEATRKLPRYNWNPATYWCPFRAGHIGRRSRLAVSRQVLLVTGEDPATGAALIYSINFSFSTMDRTWRWRRLPAQQNPDGTQYFDDAAVSAGAEPIKDIAESVYPQTIRLREDMTIHLKGTHGAKVGHWYQRYLPGFNQLVPFGDQLAPGRPRVGYTHAWKFLPDAVFQAADQFSHLGVYDTVDSRTQYYEVQGVPAEGTWVDDEYQLYVRALKFWWCAPLRGIDTGSLFVGMPQKRPPSLFNRDTRLRIVKRGSRWIAMHWDKRDDDLMPFGDGKPMQVELKNGATRVKVTLQPNTWIEGPPGAPKLEFVWTGDPNFPATIVVTSPFNVWRVRMAAFDPPPDPRNPDSPPQVVSLLDMEFDGHFVNNHDGSYEYRWALTASDQARLRKYCSPDGAMKYGTSIWFEDIVGHVSVPQELRWLVALKITVAPTAIPVGIPVQVTVHAEDTLTLKSVAASVLIDGKVVGKTDTVFTYTFISHIDKTPDPETPPGHARPPVIGEEIFPIGTVTASDYRDGDIPFNFTKPKLRLWVEPSSVPISQAIQFTVHAQDASTQVPVSGTVKIAGRDVGSTNALLRHTFSADESNGAVSATGYPNAVVSFGLVLPAPPPPPPPRPQMKVSVDPSVFRQAGHFRSRCMPRTPRPSRRSTVW